LSSRGFTLVEALLSMAILGILAAAMVPAFLTQVQSNTRSEMRTSAILAAQQIMEDLRLEDPGTLPASGASAPQQVVAGSQTFEVVTRYCVFEAYCDAATRHLVVEVFQDGRRVYDAETVYTRLR
jgi:prepilin-type N-terminal cleavage/methylation domain-containing protein